MSREDDLELQLRSFGDTLRQQVGEPIAPSSPSGRPDVDGRPARTDRRRWAALAAAAAVVALVVGLLALVQDGDEADAPVATQPTTPSTTITSSTTVQPATPELSLIDHVVLVDGEAVGEPWTTGVASTSDELTELWGDLGLQGAAPAVDFTNDVVLYFNPAESGSCRFGPLDGVAHDPATGRVFPVLPYEDPAADVIDGERICTSDANPHAILVQVVRTDLPTTDFVVWVNGFDPPANVLNRVTRVAAGELLTSPTDATTTTDVTEPRSSAALGALDFNLDSDPLRNPSLFGYSALTEVDDAALVDDVSEALGDPDDDTGWIPMPEEFACTGAVVYRSLLWADVRFVLARSDGPGITYVAAWSVGDTALAYSPALAVEITEPSGITTADGIGLGSSADQLEDVDWAQSMRQGNQFFGLAGTGPVVFQLNPADQVAAMSYEQNDC
jgi:hypothetical protein